MDLNSKEQFIENMRKLKRPADEIKSTEEKLEKGHPTLYRYRAINNKEHFDKYRASELRGNIFLQVNKELNDPMDMFFAIGDIEVFEKERLFNSLMKHALVTFGTAYLKNDGLTDDEIGKLMNSDTPYQELKKILQNTGSFDYTQGFEKSLVKVLEKWNSVFQDVKVACFTDTDTNTSMWVNYADNYNGICLEYDTVSLNHTNNQIEVFPYIAPVVYTDDLPSMYDLFGGISDFNLDEEVRHLMQQMVFFKTNDWSYEKEWRISSSITHETMGANLYPEEEVEIERLFSVSNKTFLNNELLPQDIGGELHKISMKYSKKRENDFLNRVNKGVTIFIGKPSKIYLGHKLAESEPNYLSDIIRIANEEPKTKIYVMQVVNGKYSPIAYEDFLVKKHTKKANELAKKMESLRVKRKFKKALNIYKKATKITPHRSYLLFSECFQCNYYLKRYDVAYEMICKVIAIEPNNPIYHNNLGACLRKLEQYSEAVDVYNRAISMFTLIPLFYINLTVCYVYLGEYDNALEVIKKAKLTRFYKSSFDEELRKHEDFNSTIKAFPEFKALLEKHLGLYDLGI